MRSIQLQALLRYLFRIGATVGRRGGIPPYDLRLNITDRCDCRCETCGIWRRPGREGDELTAEEIVRSAASLSSSLLWVGISGGEPTLRKDFADIVNGLAVALPNLVLLKFHTNGLNTERIVSRVKSSLGAEIPFYLAIISLDGVGDVHDRLRGAPGAFDSAVRTAELLVELEERNPHFSVSFETTISPLNRDNLLDVHAFVSERFPGHAHINTLANDSYLVGRNGTSGAFAGPDELPMIKQLAASMQIRSLKDIVPKAYLGLVERFFSRKESPIRCLAGRDTIVMDSGGNIRACDYQEDAAGNIADTGGDLRLLLNDPAVRAKLDGVSSCRDCFSPCAAFPSLARSPHYILLGLLNSFSYRRTGLQNRGTE